MEKNKKIAIENIQRDIINISKKMSSLFKQQSSLVRSLEIMLLDLDPETKKRYDEELASDTWKKYYKK